MAKLLTKIADIWKFIFLVDGELVGETVENKSVQELDYWLQLNWCPRRVYAKAWVFWARKQVTNALSHSSV